MSLPKPDEAKTLPAYSIAQAARYIGAPASTVRSWFTGSHPILKKHDDLVSFVELVQAHVLHTIRVGCRLPMRSIRRASNYLAGIKGSLTMLAHKDFFLDSSSLFLSIEERLISLCEGGQIVDREIIKEGLRQLHYGNDGFADRFYPKERGQTQRDFALSPVVNFGGLYIARLGVGVDALHQRFIAGESIKDIADDYGATQPEVEDAIRWHDLLAA